MSTDKQPSKKRRIEEDVDNSDSDSDSNANEEYEYDLMVSFQSCYNRAINAGKLPPVESLPHYTGWVVEMLHCSLEKCSRKMYVHFKMDKDTKNIYCSTSANISQTECLIGKANNTVIKEVMQCDNKRKPFEFLQKVLALSYNVMFSAPESSYLNPFPNYTIELTFKHQSK